MQTDHFTRQVCSQERIKYIKKIQEKTGDFNHLFQNKLFIILIQIKLKLNSN